MERTFDIVKSGHIEFLVTDLKEAREFYVETLGFVATESDRSHVYLRGLEERHRHSLMLTRTGSPYGGSSTTRRGRRSGGRRPRRAGSTKRCW